MGRKIRLIFILFTAALLLGACSLPGLGNATSTALPMLQPSVVVFTATIRPSATHTTVVLPSVTAEPTLTATATQVPLPTWDWSIEKVDGRKQGLFSSLVFAPGDIPYIAYLDDNEDDLKIASYEKGDWRIQAFESPWVDGFYPSIAIDNQGRPQVVRWILSMRRLAYMPWTKAEGWVVKTSLTKLRVASASMALDHARVQVPHIAFYDLDTGEVKYTRYRPSGWVVLVVDQTIPDGTTFPLALDSIDRPYVAYYKDQTGLMIAVLETDGKTWQIQVVDAGAGMGLFPALVLDDKDMPHLSYIDASRGVLKYAHIAGGEWETQVVDESGNAGGKTSIAISPEGNIHISYYDRTEGALIHALGVDGRWQLDMVDNEGDAGVDNSLALDSAGNPHISYYDRKSRNLKYASGK